MFDLGDPIPLSINIRDAAGALANATAVTLSITQPDGTAATITNPVAPASTGVYTYSFTPTQAGRHGVRWVATGTNASAYTDAFDVDEAAPLGIVSLADVKAHLNITSTTNDEELRRFIDAATDFIESRIGPVVRRSITATVFPQSGLLFLTPPVVSLTTMTYAYGYSGSVDVTGVYLDGYAGVVRPAYGTTFAYPVTVTYVGGRAIVPALIQQAALDYVKWSWETQRGSTPLPLPGGVNDFEVATPATVPYRILQALEPYVSPVVA